MSLGTMAPVSTASVTSCGFKANQEDVRADSSGQSSGAAFVSEFVSVPDVRVWI